MSSLSSGALALAGAGANLILCAGLVAVLLATRGGREGSAATAPPPPPPPAAETVTSSFEPLPTSSAPHTLGGYDPVSGPGGMTTVIPNGWPSKPGRSAGSTQADDPAGRFRFVRYGGAPEPAKEILESHLDYERTFSRDYQGYRRIRLENLAFHGFDSIDWEFEWDAPEGTRHVRSLYWRAQGFEFYVYASSLAADWPQTQPILDNMIAHASP